MTLLIIVTGCLLAIAAKIHEANARAMSRKENIFVLCVHGVAVILLYVWMWMDLKTM